MSHHIVANLLGLHGLINVFPGFESTCQFITSCTSLFFNHLYIVTYQVITLYCVTLKNYEIKTTKCHKKSES